MLGALAVAPSSPGTITLQERDVLESFVRQGALAVERARLAEDAKAAALRARTEEMQAPLSGFVVEAGAP